MLREIIEGPTAAMRPTTDQAGRPSASMTVPRYIPHPTREYRQHRKLLRATAASPAVRPFASSRARSRPSGDLIPFLSSDHRLPRPDVEAGSSVSEIGIRKAFLPGLMLAGAERQSYLHFGAALVSPNAMADYIETPGTQEFDAFHTFAVVRRCGPAVSTGPRRGRGAMAMEQRLHTDAISVFPRQRHPKTPSTVAISRRLKFFFKPGSPPGTPQVFTCRSFDIVAQTGHAILDGLKPGWFDPSNQPQTGGLHESFR